MGTVVEGVAAFGDAVEGADRSALGVFTDVDGVVDAPTDAGARAAPIAIPAPRVVARPTLAQPTKRRLRDAG